MTPIQLDPGGHINTFADTTIQQAQMNTLHAVKAQVEAFNDQTKAGYLLAFGNWAISVVAGRLGNENPPVPPAAFVVEYFTDPTSVESPSGPILWAYPSQTGKPVCDMPPVPHVTTPPAPLPEPDYIRNVPAGDIMPVGFTFTLPSGERWQKQSSHTPFGIAYFYAKLPLMLIAALLTMTTVSHAHGASLPPPPDADVR